MDAKNYFPSDVLKFIKQNVAPRQILKWMKVCKYFQHDIFPFYPVDSVEIVIKTPEYFPKLPQAHKEGSLYQSDNLWLKGNFASHLSHGRVVSKVVSKIAYCTIVELTLNRQNISIHDLQFLTSTGNVKRFNWIITNCLNEDGNKISLEDILNCVKNVEKIKWEDSSTSFSSKRTAKSVYLPKLKKFELTEYPETFNLTTFLPFFVNHNHSAFNIFLNCSENRLNEFRKKYEMKIENSNKNFEPVYISRNIYTGNFNISDMDF